MSLDEIFVNTSNQRPRPLTPEERVLSEDGHVQIEKAEALGVPPAQAHRGRQRSRRGRDRDAAQAATPTERIPIDAGDAIFDRHGSEAVT